ncbi:MAG TPA: PAS domain S-box protein [Bacteroidales bacterium]|nr:PAS domain S-box protein [Bacteroidales bacterium]
MTNGVPTYEELLQENQSLKTRLDQLEEHGSDRQLWKQEQFYRLLARVSFDYVFVSKVISNNNLDLEWVIGAFEAITGYTLEEYKAAGGWRGRIHPDDLAVDDHDFKELLANRSVNTEIRTIRKDGSCLWVQVYAQPVWNQKDDRMEGIYGAVQDITKRKNAETALTESQEKYRLLVENSSEAVLVAQDGILKFFNKRTTEIVGYSREEMTARPFTDFVHPDDRPVVLERHVDRLEGREVPSGYHFRIRAHDGSIIWVMINSVLIEWEGRPAILIFLTDITEKKEIELQLQKQYNLNVNILETMTDAFVALDRNWCYTYMNEKAGVIFNRDPKAMIGKHIWTEFPEGVGQLFHQNYERAVREQVPITMEEYYPPYDKWFENRICPFTDGLVIFFQDITIRKKAELALMESEEKYRTLVESASDSILIIQEGKIVFANHIPYKISGYAPEEIVGAPFVNFIDPEDREIVGTLYEKRQRGEDVAFSYETRIVLRNGELRPAEISITCFTYHEKQAELVFIRDIAERKQLEVSRDQERSLLKTLINNLPVSVFVKDRNLKKTAVNTAHLKRMALTLDRPGLREEDVLGRTDFDLYPGELAQVYYQEDKRVIEEGETIHEREDHSVDRQGNPVWELISKFPLRDPDGKIVGMIGIAYEITELKKALEAITLMNQNLEQHVADRTAELEAANKDLEAFAYSVSHDLRAPLRHIDGFSRILQRNLTNPSAEVLRDLGKICDSTAKMGSMIDALLKFSRLGRKALSKTEVNLNYVVRQVINQFRPAIEHRNIRFVTTELPTVMGDHALLLIVFENLISNAVKFTAGKEEAVIEIGQETGGDAKPVIFVKDNGVGFDMIYAEKLFNVFQRLHTDEEFEGTGVGLANVKRIIQKHGGTIRAAAGVNQGAAFYLTL